MTNCQKILFFKAKFDHVYFKVRILSFLNKASYFKTVTNLYIKGIGGGGKSPFSQLDLVL